MEFVVAFLAITLACAVAAPLNSNYKKVGMHLSQAKPRMRGSVGLVVNLMTRKAGLHHFLRLVSLGPTLPSWDGTVVVRMQDEFKFYLEDAQSKLLIVPAGGNVTAEGAAEDLGVPVAVFAFSSGAAAPACEA